MATSVLLTNMNRPHNHSHKSSCEAYTFKIFTFHLNHLEFIFQSGLKQESNINFHKTLTTIIYLIICVFPLILKGQ